MNEMYLMQPQPNLMEYSAIYIQVCDLLRIGVL